jgi:4-oxalocrotonate tautomerase
MPIIEVNLLEGRAPEAKERLIQALTADAVAAGAA